MQHLYAECNKKEYLMLPVDVLLYTWVAIGKYSACVFANSMHLKPELDKLGFRLEDEKTSTLRPKGAMITPKQNNFKPKIKTFDNVYNPYKDI